MQFWFARSGKVPLLEQIVARILPGIAFDDVAASEGRSLANDKAAVNMGSALQVSGGK